MVERQWTMDTFFQCLWNDIDLNLLLNFKGIGDKAGKQDFFVASMVVVANLATF